MLFSRRSVRRAGATSHSSGPSTSQKYLPVLEQSGTTTTGKYAASGYWRFIQILCGLSHLSFFLIHVALLYVAISGIEHRVEVPLGDASKTAETALTIVLQLVGISYTVVMVFTVQQLSIHRLLTVRTTITGTHDAITAWSGLGSSLLTMWYQLRIPSAIFSTLLVMIYLGGIAVLHITTPALLSLQTFNYSIPQQVAAQGILNYTNIALASNDVADCDAALNSYWGYTEPGAWTDASDALSSMITIRNLWKHTQFVGLANGTVYDVLEDNTGNALASVYATYFNVSCGTFPDGINATTANSSTVYISSPSGSYGFNNSLRPLYPGEVEVAKWRLPFATPLFFVQSTDIFIDSQGQSQGILSVNYDLPGVNGTTTPVKVNQVQTIACSLQLNPITVNVDPRTKLIQDQTPTKQSSTFAKLGSPQQFSDESCSNNDQLVQFMSQNINNASMAPWSDLYSGWCGNSCNGSWMGVIDQYLMESLSVVPYYLVNNAVIVNHSLSDLENAMSHMFATAFWADANWDNTYNTTLATLSGDTGSTGRPSRESRVSTVSGLQQVSQLSSSLPPLIVGLVISALLLSLSVPFFMSPTISRSKVSDLGILQVLWLLQNDAVSHVDEPTVDNLRKAGMREHYWGADRLVSPRYGDMMLESLSS